MRRAQELDVKPLRPLVIAIHGAVVNAASWLPLQRELGEAVEFLAPDLPGHGTNRKKSFSMAASLQVLDEMIRGVAANRPIIFIGDSLGGYLALLAGAQAGDRVHAVVAAGASFEVRGMGAFLLNFSDAVIGFAQFCLGHERSEKLLEGFVKRMTDAATAEAIIARGLRLESRHESIVALEQVDILAAVRRCRGRVYIVNGGLDIPVAWYTRQFASNAKDGYAVLIPGALHGCSVHHAAEFADVVRTAVNAAQVSIARREGLSA